MLLDEPAGGVNPEETEGLAELIRKLVRHGITVALIEHKMGMIMSLADKILVLSYGEKIAEGTPEEIAACAESHTGRFLAPLLPVPSKGRKRRAKG